MTTDWAALAVAIKAWGLELGFQAVRISDTHLASAENDLEAWLASGSHGEMNYMARHGTKRSRPAELQPGTLRVISARMNYWPGEPSKAKEEFDAIATSPTRAYVSRYALGLDYHQRVRSQLRTLARRIEDEAGSAGVRVFSDSAPVMEVAIATRSGLGWRGKHTLLLTRDAGSYFFLGEIYTSLPLPVDQAVEDHCGTCTRCIDSCPTGAILGPYRLDARRCISYLTIELKGPIPVALRPLIGNRIYGCDDCQLVCPWNRYAQKTEQPDFHSRNGLDAATLVEVFAWDADEFQRRMAGSAILRIGHERWLRNVAVALGNAAGKIDIASGQIVLGALKARAEHASELVREHVQWAIAQHHSRPAAKA